MNAHSDWLPAASRSWKWIATHRRIVNAIADAAVDGSHVTTAASLARLAGTRPAATMRVITILGMRHLLDWHGDFRPRRNHRDRAHLRVPIAINLTEPEVQPGD